MIRLVANANSIIAKLAFKDSVRGYYLGVIEKYKKGYKQTFATELQNLITKLGIMISEVDKKGPNISYCSSSIDYLCLEVLNSPKLKQEFHDLKINSQGNIGKHTLDLTNVDMKKSILLYNKIVTRIEKKYKLTSLEIMLIDPKCGKPKKETLSIERNPLEKGATHNEHFKLFVQLDRGEGRYKKGLFKKVGMLNFKLKINAENPNNYKIKSITAILKCGKNKFEKKIGNINSTTDFDLPTSEYSGQIEATVIVVYKIGLLKTKEIKSTVSKYFN